MDGNEPTVGIAEVASNSGRFDVGDEQSSRSPEDAEFSVRLTRWEKKALGRDNDSEACLGAITARLAAIVYGHQGMVERAMRLSVSDGQDRTELTQAIAANAGLTRRLE